MDNCESEEVELVIDGEEAGEVAPVTQVEPDPAAEAFAQLEGELALMRRAVQHLAAERADIVIPDYGKTLAEMTKRLGAISGSLDEIAGHPALRVTPDSFGGRIEAAAEAARRGDQARINDAHRELGLAAQDMRAVTSHARKSAEQRRQIWQGVGVGVIAGILPWSFLPGTIARAVPESWQWPERLAVRLLDEGSGWDAGVRLIRTDSEQAWSAVMQAARMARENGRTLDRCISAANSTKKPVRCSVNIDPDPDQ